jgi:hypothetical protein
MVGTMANDVDQTKMVKGHDANGKRHKAKLKVLEDLTIIVDVGW